MHSPICLRFETTQAESFVSAAGVLFYVTWVLLWGSNLIQYLQLRGELVQLDGSVGWLPPLSWLLQSVENRLHTAEISISSWWFATEMLIQCQALTREPAMTATAWRPFGFKVLQALIAGPCIEDGVSPCPRFHV